MSRRRVLLLLKPLDVYTGSRTQIPSSSSSSSLIPTNNLKIKHYLDDRCRVHKNTINLCQDVLRRKSLDWEPLLRTDLCQPIHGVDLVVSVGGDGTLLRASHFMNDSIPIIGVNSDPTQTEEVKELGDEFDARRSTGYLCAATAGNFEQVLDEILVGHRVPSKLSRISICLNGQILPTNAMNDILIAHPCPADASHFSFLMKRDNQMTSPRVNCRSSGLRVSTAAGSTAAMLSAGGFLMPILCEDLQYMVREPILTGADNTHLLHAVIRSDQSMHATWYSKEGFIYIDGSHVSYPIQYGDAFEISCKAPILKVFLPSHLLR